MWCRTSSGLGFGNNLGRLIALHSIPLFTDQGHDKTLHDYVSRPALYHISLCLGLAQIGASLRIRRYPTVSKSVVSSLFSFLIRSVCLFAFKCFQQQWCYGSRAGSLRRFIFFTHGLFFFFANRGVGWPCLLFLFFLCCTNYQCCVDMD